MNYGKTKKYVIEPPLNKLLTKTQRKIVFYNSSYRISKKKWSLAKIRQFDYVIAELVTSSKLSLCQHVPDLTGFHCSRFHHFTIPDINNYDCSLRLQFTAAVHGCSLRLQFTVAV